MEEFIHDANRNMDKVPFDRENAVVWAFFYLATAAVMTLVGIASSVSKIAVRLDAWEGQGTLDVTIHERDKF